MTVPRQLALALPHSESFARDDFLVGTSNRAALAMIERWPDWPDRALALVGPEGAGKSHLAAIWAEIAGAQTAIATAIAATPVIAFIFAFPICGRAQACGMRRPILRRGGPQQLKCLQRPMQM